MGYFESPPVVDHLIVVKNEASTNAHRMQRQVAEIVGRGMVQQIDYHDVKFNPEAMADVLEDGLKERTAIVTAMGDGGNSFIGNVCLSEGGRERKLNDVPLLFGHGGNANDIATMLTGRSSLATVLENGWSARYQPLEFTINEDDPGFALGYFSAGGSAAASQRLEDIKQGRLKDHPHLRFIQEAISSGLTTASYPPFFMSKGERGAKFEVTDILAMHGDRIAKIGRPHARLDRPEFELVSLRSHGKVHTTREMVKLQRGKLRGIMHERFPMHLESDDGQPIMAQADGQAFEIPSKSDVNITVSEHSYTALTTRS